MKQKRVLSQKTFISLALLLFLGACSDSSHENHQERGQPIMTLKGPLYEVSSSLSGTFTVYNKDDGSAVDSVSLLFTEGDDEETTVSSEEITLQRGTSYRFILIFFWDGIPIAYVDSTQATEDSEATTIAFTEGQLVYDPPEGLSASESEDFSSDLSSGFLPDLDADDDGYSNFDELKSGSDPNSSASIPEGPAIADFEATLSDDGNTLALTATLSDENGLATATLDFENASYLSEVVTESISGEIGNETWLYSSQFNPQYAPEGELIITLTATNTLGLENSAETTVTITDNGTNVGPIIDFESVSEGDTIGGTVSLALRAYDNDIVASVTVSSPSGLTNTSTATDRFVADWDTTTVGDGAYTLSAQATDSLGAMTTQSISITISNEVDESGPTISLTVYESDNPDATIDYENGATVYGEIAIFSVASDPSGVESTDLINEDDLAGVLGTPVTSSSTYLNTIDTTQLSDDATLSLEFQATDDLGNESERTFSLTVKNYPAIESFTVNGLSEATIASGDEVTFSWSTTLADTLEITRNDASVASALSGDDVLSMPITNSGDYILTAVHSTNVGDFTVTKIVTINVDDDGDGVLNEDDNCDLVSNADQADFDGDGLGDACDDDMDGDGSNNNDDCEELDPAIYPGAVELLNGIDDDCDDVIDTIVLDDATAKFIGEDDSDEAGISVSLSGDVNNDGYDDILIGAYVENFDSPRAGSAYLIDSPVSGTIDLSSASSKFTGQGVDDSAGISVTFLDVDGDGSSEILTGAYTRDLAGSNAGEAYLLYGPFADGVLSLSTADAMFIGEDAVDYAGYSLATGDFDNDGHDDFLISANGDDEGGTDAGAVYLYYGAESFDYNGEYDLSGFAGYGAKLIGEEAGDNAGISVASAGDVNNDGYDDILVGAYKYDSVDATNGGAVYLLHGPIVGMVDLSTANAKFTGEDDNDDLGYSVSSAGDMNNDGYDDLLISAPYSDDGGNAAGAVYLVYGSISGTYEISSIVDAKFIGNDALQFVGSSVQGVGDVNGDGFDDIVIGAYGVDSSTGAAYLVFGQSAQLSGTFFISDVADATFEGEVEGDQTGASISPAGDVNNDGLDDILIGANKESTGGNDAGAAYLILSNF